MQVILLEDLEGLGARGATVNVKPGYARNFLLPRKLAITLNRSATAVNAAIHPMPAMRAGGARRRHTRSRSGNVNSPRLTRAIPRKIRSLAWGAHG